MSSQDKEKIKELNKKIKDLELLVTQKNQSLQDYQDIERIADGTNYLELPNSFVVRKNQGVECYSL